MAFNVDLSLPSDFTNIVRLFPLPNLILFPGVMQGLHVFEPRYRQMMKDALTADNLITMAVLKSNSAKQEYELRPEIHSTACVGKIVTHSRTEDGRYNLLLVGAKRARIVREIISDKAYRMAEVEVLEDTLEISAEQLRVLRQRLVDEFMDYASHRQGLNEETIRNMLVDTMPFGLLIDLICYAVGLDPEDQIRVLETQETSQRCELVLTMMQRKRSAQKQKLNTPSPDDEGDFPPDFSIN
jgi:ATP-dependent Lon protease